MPAIGKDRISADLRKLSLRQGECVMMHSSLSALGPVQGGAETVMDALLEVLGPAGTLVVPAFRDSVWGDPADFTNSDCDCSASTGLCTSQQPGFQGIIAETVRQRSGSLRSCYSTHSWVALGPAAEQLLRTHKGCPTVCGHGNPFEPLVQLDGCILTLGVQVNTITLWHYYEEILQVPYMGHFWLRKRHLNHCVAGRRIQYEFPGIMQDVCRSAGILKTGTVGKSTSGLMRARDFDRFMATIMADNPYCMVLRPPDRSSGDLAIDALRKAERMLQAWADGPKRPDKTFGCAPAPVKVPGPGAHVRDDCPAFAGWHQVRGRTIPLCCANGRHPELFRMGGICDHCGVTTCDRCSWNEEFCRET